MKKTILITLILLTFCFSVFAQEDKNLPVGTAVSIENRPADEGGILGDTPEYKIRGNNLDYLMSFRRPDLQIVFNSSQKLNVESSKKIGKILDSHWKEAIEFYYKYNLKKFSASENPTDEMLKWTLRANKNQDKLQENFIDAPNGNRKISNNEAGDLLAFLNHTAIDIMEKAKDAKGEYKNIKIKSKPQVRIGECKQDSGQVILMVTFDKSAKITEVEVESSSGCRDFDENAVQAARKIKFVSATVDGEPITVEKKVAYTFRRF
jgi:TonB family protein